MHSSYLPPFIRFIDFQMRVFSPALLFLKLFKLIEKVIEDKF